MGGIAQEFSVEFYVTFRRAESFFLSVWADGYIHFGLINFMSYENSFCAH